MLSTLGYEQLYFKLTEYVTVLYIMRTKMCEIRRLDNIRKCEISDSHDGKNEEDSLLEYSAV
jgi:hypothetical protein